MLCAAPSYLEKHGVPKNPIDLKKHNCLVMRFGMNLDNIWRFGPDAMQQIVTVRGDRIANDGALVRQGCLAGNGIMMKSELDVGPDIRAGHLVELLAGYAQAAPVQMLFTDVHHALTSPHLVNRDAIGFANRSPAICKCAAAHTPDKNNKRRRQDQAAAAAF